MNFSFCTEELRRLTYPTNLLARDFHHQLTALVAGIKSFDGVLGAASHVVEPFSARPLSPVKNATNDAAVLGEGFRDTTFKPTQIVSSSWLNSQWRAVSTCPSLVVGLTRIPIH